MLPHRVEISRGEYIKMTGRVPDSHVIGAVLYSKDGEAIVEYLFTDQKEIEELEALLRL